MTDAPIFVTDLSALRAHEQRRAAAFGAAAPDLTTLWDARLDDLIFQIREALTRRPIRDFALGHAVMIEDGRPMGVIRLRMDGRVWRLSTIDAALLAIHLRLTPDLRGRDLFADALSLASREAEQRIDTLNRFGVAVSLEDRA